MSALTFDRCELNGFQVLSEAEMLTIDGGWQILTGIIFVAVSVVAVGAAAVVGGIIGGPPGAAAAAGATVKYVAPLAGTGVVSIALGVAGG
jgi:hypothetical protein